ncbi:MAG TPA: hypothetical protein VKH81_08275 [Candidatus Angelobacter sp.]|nr:hypothetical protein [Candidatus Angelobacter sp.]
MPLKQRCQTPLSKFLGTLACVLCISSGNATLQPHSAKPNNQPLRVELCEVLRNSEFYEGKQITVRATFRLGRKQSQLFCMACIDGGWVWMREVLPASGEIAPGLKALNDLIQENEKGIMVNGVFTGTFRGPGVYGRLGAFTYQIDVQEVREIELISHAGPDPEDLSAAMKKKVCQ